MGSAGVIFQVVSTTNTENGTTITKVQALMQIIPPIYLGGPDMQQPQRNRLFPGHI